MPHDEDPAHIPTLAQDSDDTQVSARAIKPPSRPLLSDYDVGSLLGSGGMGEVVQGHDKAIGRDVAIKRLRSVKPSPEAVARFLREARIQARLEHPAIVPVHHIGHDDAGLPYFTMKKLIGTTFAELLASAARPPRQRMLRLFAEACSAVEFAHSRGVVHRDLKPANIMVGDHGEVYVLDWGLARIVVEREVGGIGDEVPSLDGLTEAGVTFGTPGYMAPEQVTDAATAGPAADVYALGAILFELLAEVPLHPRGKAAIGPTLKGITEGPARRRPNAHVPPELDELCIWALTSHPDGRPTVKELAARLQGYLDGDRDVVRRRELAASYVEQARAALASGDVANRAGAMSFAGRALVLDPESAEAGELVTRLTFETPAEYPAELREELTASEVTVQRRQGRAAMGSFAVVLGYLAIAATNGVRDWAVLFGIVAYLAVHVAVVWRITQRRATPGEMLVVAAGNAILAALLSRTLGSMIIVPAVTCIMALSLTSYPQLIDRKWAVIGFLVASWVTPVVLEEVGVLDSTWKVAGEQVVLSSDIVMMGGNHTAAILIGSNIVTIVVFGLFASALATSRRDAMRQAEVQAWHLRQLLPKPRAAR